MKAFTPLLACLIVLVVGCSLPTAAAPHRLRASPAADDGAPQSWVGSELRAYPAGVIPAVYGELPLSSHELATLELAANLTDREDFGKHDEEEGDGFGGGVGYRHFFGEELGGWFMGARVDLWSLEIDWRDKLGTPKKRRGSTDILVLQPTFEVGYGFLLDRRVRLNVFGAAGAEINVSTHGEHVGEGAIGLLGLSLVFGF